MKPISAPNYTQIPNVILDSLAQFESADLVLILVVARATFGWHRESVRMTLSQLEILTGFSKSAICRSIRTLEKKDILERAKLADGFTYRIKVEAVPSRDTPLSHQETATCPLV